MVSSDFVILARVVRHRAVCASAVSRMRFTAVWLYVVIRYRKEKYLRDCICEVKGSRTRRMLEIACVLIISDEATLQEIT